MARRSSNVAFLAAILIASLLQISMAQTTHVVGDSLNWVVPPGGASVYANWAANLTFRVGDTLVFNFSNAQHDVAKVSKANFDNCNATSPISLTTTSPARIPLSASGDHYFFCSFPGHCLGGQKLAINVSAASSSPTPRSSPSPAPQPSTGSPVSVPAPAPQPTTPSPASAPPQAPASSAPSPAPVTNTPAPTPASNPPSPTASPPNPPSGATSPTSPGGAVPSSNSPPPSDQAAPPPPNSAASIGRPAIYASLALFVAMFY